MGDVTYAQVRGNLDARIASGEFQGVERASMPGRQLTTAYPACTGRPVYPQSSGIFRSPIGQRARSRSRPGGEDVSRIVVAHEPPVV
jgi:hypothetical protein